MQKITKTTKVTFTRMESRKKNVFRKKLEGTLKLWVFKNVLYTTKGGGGC